MKTWILTLLVMGFLLLDTFELMVPNARPVRRPQVRANKAERQDAVKAKFDRSRYGRPSKIQMQDAARARFRR